MVAGCERAAVECGLVREQPVARGEPAVLDNFTVSIATAAVEGDVPARHCSRWRYRDDGSVGRLVVKGRFVVECQSIFHPRQQPVAAPGSGNPGHRRRGGGGPERIAITSREQRQLLARRPSQQVAARAVERQRRHLALQAAAPRRRTVGAVQQIEVARLGSSGEQFAPGVRCDRAEGGADRKFQRWIVAVAVEHQRTARRRYCQPATIETERQVIDGSSVGIAPERAGDAALPQQQVAAAGRRCNSLPVGRDGDQVDSAARVVAPEHIIVGAAEVEKIRVVLIPRDEVRTIGRDANAVKRQHAGVGPGLNAVLPKRQSVVRLLRRDQLPAVGRHRDRGHPWPPNPHLHGGGAAGVPEPDAGTVTCRQQFPVSGRSYASDGTGGRGLPLRLLFRRRQRQQCQQQQCQQQRAQRGEAAQACQLPPRHSCGSSSKRSVARCSTMRGGEAAAFLNGSSERTTRICTNHEELDLGLVSSYLY